MRRFIPVLAIFFCLIATALIVPMTASHSYGPPAASLNPIQIFEYSAKLVWDDGLLIKPLDPNAPQQLFTISQGESVPSIASRLEEAHLIGNAAAFRDYLIYTGLDTSIQAGNYTLSSAMSVIDIARAMQNAAPTQATLVILPGWRMEEIAVSIPTSGLEIAPQAFLAAAKVPPHGFDFLSGAASAEGFLYPDSYVLPRAATPDQIIEGILRVFALHLTTDLREGFDHQGLSVYQAVTLASIVQRETEHDDEAPLIASVYLNRLKAGMKLEADPTVQYALGYDPVNQTWWTNPLSLDNLKIDSPYNTYLISSLPPAPISNPGLSALRAVAFPAETSYYFFQAKCDGSGYHVFAETFDEHLQNTCP